MPSTDTLPPPMFDVQELLAGDGPRARLSDPVQSHMAADRSQATVKPTKRAVLILLLQEGEATGAELNDLYRLRAARNDWGSVAYDTPRKRAEELYKDGYLAARHQTSDGNHLPEAVYTLTVKGLEVVA